MKNDLRIHFSTGYAGNVKAEITFDDGKTWKVLELDHIKDILLDNLISRGYTLSKTTRQKYERVTINK